jgi:hypothetical protein
VRRQLDTVRTERERRTGHGTRGRALYWRKQRWLGWQLACDDIRGCPTVGPALLGALS